MKNISVDSKCKQYFKNPNRFASLMNGTFFCDFPLDQDSLVLWDIEETNVIEERKGTRRGKENYRDLMMKGRVESLPVLLALENQAKNDYSMVLRTQNYDSMNYLKQWETSPYDPHDRFVVPVLTFVINWGQNRWHCDNSLEDLSTGIPPSLKHMFNNYRMNFYDVKDMDINKIEDEELKNVIDAIQRIYKIKKENYQRVLKGIELNKESLEFVAVITNNEELYEKSIQMREGEKVNMCEALDNVMEYVRSEGFNQGVSKGISQGINQGISQGIMRGKAEDVKQLMKNGNMDMHQAMNLLGIVESQKTKIQEFIN